MRCWWCAGLAVHGGKKQLILFNIWWFSLEIGIPPSLIIAVCKVMTIHFSLFNIERKLSGKRKMDNARICLKNLSVQTREGACIHNIQFSIKLVLCRAWTLSLSQTDAARSLPLVGTKSFHLVSFFCIWLMSKIKEYG